MPEKQRIALVTGASRGVGRGVATSLAEAGYTVFGTGRSIETAQLPAAVIRVPCDHLIDRETDNAFDRVANEGGGWTCSSTRRGAATNGWSKTVSSHGRSRFGSNRAGDGPP